MTTKKITAGILAAVMALSLAACGDVDESSSKSKSAGDAKESSSVAETVSAPDKEESSEVESKPEENSQDESVPDNSVSTDKYEFGQSLLGMGSNKARELLKSTYPDAKESTDSFQGEPPVTVYIYEGDISFIGQSFDSMHIAVNEQTDKVTSAAFVANSGNRDRTVDMLYSTLLVMTKDKYGEGEYSKTGDDELSNEYTLWNDGHVFLQFMHSAAENKSTLSLAFEDKPEQEVDYDTNDPDSVEKLMGKFEGCNITDAEKIVNSIFGSSYTTTEDTDRLNALGKRYDQIRYSYTDSFSLLGEEFWNVTVDFDQEDKSVYTVGFCKNTDVNTTNGYTPDEDESKKTYDKLYALFSESFGEPDTKFTPDQYYYFGALWKNTPYGEVWIAWGDKIFGSEQADCVVSFSRSGISGVQ